MHRRQAEGWSRREFLGGLVLAGAAGFLGLRPESLAAEPPPETTTLRLVQTPGDLCMAPQFVAEQFLRDEGFTEVQYIKKDGSRGFEVALASGEANINMCFAPDAVMDGRALGDHFEGRAAIRSFIEDWFGVYEELEFGLEEVHDLGKGVVFAVVTQNGRPVGSAGHVQQREGWVYVWVGGLIAQFTISDIDEARAAAERLAQERE